MTDIVERVARAIQADAQLSNDSPVDYGDAEGLARAALAAMLESVGEPEGWKWHNPKFGYRLEQHPLTDNYNKYQGWTETPLYSLAALREEL